MAVLRETLLAMLEAADRRDRDAWLEMHAPDHRVTTVGDWPGRTVDIRSGEEAWDFYIDVMDAVEGINLLEHARIVRIGGEKALLHVRGTVTGRASGLDAVMEYWWLITFVDGLAVHDQWFSDEAEALRAIEA